MLASWEGRACTVVYMCMTAVEARTAIAAAAAVLLQNMYLFLKLLNRAGKELHHEARTAVALEHVQLHQNRLWVHITC